MISRRTLFFGLGAAATAASMASPFNVLAQSSKANRTPKRIALLVGIDTYDVPEIMPKLRTPLNDVKAIGDKLDGMGIDTIRLTNPNAAALRAGIQTFLARLKDADIAIVYYAGHGIQATLEGSIPVKIFAPSDFRDPTIGIEAHDRTTAFESAIRSGQVIELSEITEAIQKAGKVGVVFWDACRNNPYYVAPVALKSDPKRFAEAGTGRLTRAIGNDPVALRTVEPAPAPIAKAPKVNGPYGVVVHNATQPGRVADDGTGQHSPYAAALLTHIAKRGVSVFSMLQAVTTDVARATEGRQIPQMENNLIGGDVVLSPQAITPSESAGSGSQPQATPPRKTASSSGGGGGGGGNGGGGGGGSGKDCAGQGCSSVARLPNGSKIVIETKGVAPF